MPPLQIHQTILTHRVTIQTVPCPSDRTSQTTTVAQRNPKACPIGKHPPAAKWIAIPSLKIRPGQEPCVSSAGRRFQP
jgi:hypothetical protein